MEGIILRLVRGFVVARGPAGIAIHQAVGAEANVNYRLAEAAILLTLAVGFSLLTLRASEFRGAGGSA